MAKKAKNPQPHEFTKLPGFNQAMKKLAKVPKGDVDRREQEVRRQRKR